MWISLVFLGCQTAGPAVVPVPDFTARSPQLTSPTALQLQTAARTPATPLPNGLEPEKPSRDWKYIVLHHSATEGGDVASIDQAHRQRRDKSGKPWLGIGYHLVVGGGPQMADGLVEPTFRWREQIHGAHCGDHEHNERGIGICLIGNFENAPPSPRQITATRELVRQLQARYRIPNENVLLHRSLTATECPGKLFQIRDILLTETPAAQDAPAATGPRNDFEH